MQNVIKSPEAHIVEKRIVASTAGRKWIIERAGSLEDMWDAMCDVENPDDHIPYWTELWPSSLVLSQWLAMRMNEIRGKPCLDLGCGLGLTAMTGQNIGARTLAVDYELDALQQARINSHINKTKQAAWLCMDWRRPSIKPGSIWRVWAADIIYERRFFKPVMKFLQIVLKQNGAAWIAEPGREIFQGFIKTVIQTGFNAKSVFQNETKSVYQNSQPIKVTVWEIRRGQEKLATL